LPCLACAHHVFQQPVRALISYDKIPNNKSGDLAMGLSLCYYLKRQCSKANAIDFETHYKSLFLEKQFDA
jgi:hypothetical protein